VHRTGRSRAPRLARTYAQLLTTFGTPTRRLVLLAIVAYLVLAPALLSGRTITIYTLILMAVPGAVALNALQGVAGQVSAGNAAFMAVGAVSVAAVMRSEPNLPFLVSLFIGGCAAGVVGALIALPAVRIRGLYLLIATIALYYLTIYVGDYYQGRTVGDLGFTYPIPNVFGLRISSTTDWYFLLLVFAVLSVWIFKNWLSSRVGRAWTAVREGEEAAAILGVDVARTKIGVFVATSFIIGVQGVLFAYFTQIVQVDNFTLDLSIQYIAIVIIGGQASVLGTVLGAIFVEAMPYVLQDWAGSLPAGFPGANLINNQIYDAQDFVYGLLIIVFLLWAPGGLVELWERAARRLRAWPFRRSLTIRSVLE
jgi:branched-chain amino acid transport system permease protein